MLTAFKQYLASLKLGSVSRKLYLADVRKFLLWLAGTTASDVEGMTLSQVSSPKVYREYLDSLKSLATAPSMVKRITASLKQFGTFLTLTHSIPNPTGNAFSDSLTSQSLDSPAYWKYIKHFSNYLNAAHLSPLTIKSYKSDIRRYLDWGSSHLPSTDMTELLKDKNIKKYLNHLSVAGNTLTSTIERKEKSLTRFQAWYSTIYAPTHVADNVEGSTNWSRELIYTQQPPTTVLATHADPGKSWFSVKNLNYRNIAFLAILLLFTATLAVFGYRQFNRDVRLTAAYPSTPVTPNRQLSFQGRLENAGGTPITTATNFVFKLFDDPSAGTELYSSGTCSIDPDSDGVFSTQIGSTCGAGIASSVFTENADVWLEVTVASETLDPRQQIATVAYALNSETIQGFPISSTVSAIRNTVVPMNQWGEIIVGEQSPRLTGVSGTFAISAPALTLTTTSGSNGNITLAPDGTGQINFNGNTTSTNFFNVSNAQLTTGSLITGTAANNNTGFYLLNLLSGSSPTSKFSVTDAGNVTIAGDLTITGDDLFMTTNTSGYILIADGTNYNPTAISGDISLTSGGVTTIGADKITESMLKSVNGPTDELCLSYESTVGDFEWQTCGSGGGGGSNWRIDPLGTISPVNDTLDLLVGSTATSSARAGFINIASGNTPTATLSAGAAGGTFLTASGSLSTTARQSLVLGNSSSYNSTGNLLFNPNGVGSIGIGTTDPNNVLPGWASTITSKFTMEETLTDLTSTDYEIGSVQELTLNPSTTATSGVFGHVNQLTIPTGNAQNFGGITGTGSYIEHDGTGIVSSATSGDFEVSRFDTGTYDYATGVFVYASEGTTQTLGVNASVVKNLSPAATTKAIYASAGNTGVVTTGTDTTIGVDINVNRTGATGGTIDTYGEKIILNLDNAGAGTHTAYGLYIGNVTGADTNYAIYSAGGQSYLAGSLQVVGNVNLTASTNLIFGGTTSLGETTAAGDSGAFVVGTFDEFANSNSLNVQDVLDDLDAGLTTALSGAGLWTDGGAVTYLTSVTDDLAVGGTTLAASMFGIDESAGNFYFGYDNSANPTLNFEATDADAGEFGFNTNDSFFFSNANVGIGTIAPSQKLTIQLDSVGDILGVMDGGNNTSLLIADGGVATFKPTGFDFVYTFDGVSTYANNTTEAKTSAGTPFTLLALENPSNDIFYLGLDHPFATTYFDIVTAGAGVTLVKEYWNGATWTALTVTDNTSAFTVDGTITFTAPSDWATTAVNSQTKYWIRFSSSTQVTTAPTAYSVSPTTGDRFSVFAQAGDTTNPSLYVNDIGNVGIGTNTPTSKLSIGGATSTISNSSGDITIDSASNFISFAGDSIGNILNGYFSGEVGIGLADAVAKLDVHGAVTGKALVMFNETGDQDLLTASASGTTRFRLRNDGSLSLDGDYLNFALTEGSGGYGIRDNAGVMEFKSLSGAWTAMGAGGASWWDQVSGTIQPYNKTVDLLLGGSATDSAKIALINVNSGTPTASISAGTTGALYLTASGAIATTAKQTLALGDSTTTGDIILQGGNVGIGVASPVEKLEVNGTTVAQKFTDTAGSGAYYLDPANTGTSLSIDGNIVGNGAFYLTTGADATAVSIGTTGAGKLDAGTIDPPYTINGDKFATYMTSMTGVKEETTGVVRAEEYIPGLGYRATLDFAQALTGSDLWLFSKVSNLQNNLDKLVVLLSASGSGKTWYEINAEGGQLYLYSQSPSTISYRLTAPRFDSTSWLNSRDSSSIGFVINDDNQWSVPESIATLFGNNVTGPISPLAEDQSIVVDGPITIKESELGSSIGTSSALLTVEGEIDAATISARVAQLETIQADNVTARNIVADTIEANHIIGLDAKIASLSAGMSDSDFETITDRIKARLSTLSGNIPTAQDVPVPVEASDIVTQLDSDTASASATISSADIDFATINNYLAVIGTATITELSITDHLYATEISSKNGLLTLADNTMIIDSSGHVAINGDLTVSGKILADSASLNSLEIGSPASPSASTTPLGQLLAIYNEAGETVATIDASGSANLDRLTTNMITIASSAVATQSGLAELLGTAQSNATAGQNVLLAPGTELTIESPYVTPNSLVYLTPTGNTDNKVLFVKAKKSCSNQGSELPNSAEACIPSFTVGIDAPTSNDISFNWWIIELAPPTSTPAPTEEQI